MRNSDAIESPDRDRIIEIVVSEAVRVAEQKPW
jgi:hypothetical protein